LSDALYKSKPLSNESTKQRYINWFKELGIESERLELHGLLPTKDAHLKLYSQIDLALDPFPYNEITILNLHNQKSGYLSDRILQQNHRFHYRNSLNDF